MLKYFLRYKVSKGVKIFQFGSQGVSDRLKCHIHLTKFQLHDKAQQDPKYNTLPYAYI